MVPSDGVVKKEAYYEVSPSAGYVKVVHARHRPEVILKHQALVEPFQP